MGMNERNINLIYPHNDRVNYKYADDKHLAKELMEKHPIRMVEKAVKGMLPKNRLGSTLYKNMRVYAGTEHPHEAQEPQVLEIK